MGNVPRPNIVWKGAHPNNFTVGRPGASRDGRYGFHHVVGSADSAALVFQNGARQASSTYIVTNIPDLIYQSVDLGNTPYTDGVWESNIRAVTVEHHGDWRFGYVDPVVLENSAKLTAWLRDQQIVSRPYRHRDVKPTTVCPADLPVESIWNRASEIINYYNQPVDNRPEWMKNRSEVSVRTVYAQTAGIFVHNLNNPGHPLDSRRFVLNQNFEITGQTRAGGKEYWITRSSYDGNIASGILKSDVADQPFIPNIPAPNPNPIPEPTTPDWADSLLVDEANREMYVLRATPLIDLEHGRPAKDANGKDIWFQAGDIIRDISAHTIVAENTYLLTEYSFRQVEAGNWVKFGNGIKAGDLTIDPKATPIGTPANPQLPEAPRDPIEEMPDVPTAPTIPPIQDPHYPDQTPVPTQPSAPRLTLWLKLLLWISRKIQDRLAKKNSL